MHLLFHASLILPSLGALAVQAASIQRLRIDNASAQATFAVPCSNCGTSESNFSESFLFDFEAFPSETPCGSSNLTLNGVPLTRAWEADDGLSTGGQTYLLASGRNLSATWNLDCLLAAKDRAASHLDYASQLLDIVIDQIDGLRTSLPTPGFSLSFRSHPHLDLLRLLPELNEPRTQSEIEDWREPPESLRLSPLYVKDEISPPAPNSTSVEQEISELRDLETELELIQQSIASKKASIAQHLASDRQKPGQKEKQCQKTKAALKSAFDKFNGFAKSLYYSAFRQDLHGQVITAHSRHWNAAGSQSVVKMSQSEINGTRAGNTTVAQPPQAHYKDGQAGVLPLYNEKQPFTSSSQGQSEERPSLLSIIGHILFTVTGIAFLCRCCRRRRVSLRKRVDRATQREERRTARAYRRSARRQAVHDWWHGHRRSSGQAPPPGDEKRALIDQQESVLEEAMQDEIRQLRIQEDFRQMRSTRDAIDDLLRAEEGRNYHSPQRSPHRDDPSAPAPPYSQHHTHQHPHGFVPVSIPPSISYPASILTPSSTGSTITGPTFASRQPKHDVDPPLSPISRTSSLPDYRSEAAFSEPPSYHTNEDTDREFHTDTEDDVTGSVVDTESVYSRGPMSPGLGFEPRYPGWHRSAPGSVVGGSRRGSVASERVFL